MRFITQETRSCFKAVLFAVVVCCLCHAAHASPPVSLAELGDSHRVTLANQCFDCHNEDTAEGGLNLSALVEGVNDATSFSTWVKIHDRVASGEMPPDGGLPTEMRDPLVRSLGNQLIAIDRDRNREGRSVWRRMNRSEYENSLRDLLSAPWLQVQPQLPHDQEAHLFTKVGRVLDTSHIQVARYYAAAESALREVVATQVSPPDATPVRYYAREQTGYANRLRYSPFNRSPERAVFPLLDHEPDLEVLKDEEAPASLVHLDPERREKEAFGVVAGSYEPLEVRFSEFVAPMSGRYKLRFNAYTFWAGPGTEKKWWRPDRQVASRGRRSEPVSIYSRLPPRMLRKLDSFDVGIDPEVHEIDVFLLKGETIQPDAARLFRSRPPAWHNPLAERDGQPGMAMKWMEAEGPLHEEWPTAGHRLLFGDLPIQVRKTEVQYPEGPASAEVATPIVKVLSEDPEKDSRGLLRRFLGQAYRRTPPPEDVDRFCELFGKAMDSYEGDFANAMIMTYAAILCSPEFTSIPLISQKDTDRLDAYSVASRLSYFLWNSPPDKTLRHLAKSERGLDSSTLSQQVQRMIQDPKLERFVHAFCDQWLDLQNLTATSPDERLYPDYYLDDLLIDSTISETRIYVADLLRRNLPVRYLIDSDHAFVNERLAQHYDLPAVEGIKLRRVDLPKDSVRGGLLAQASILKVSANGTTTSPVTRGAWVMERLLGQKPPPPPPDVPAIEPDTRGATTVREQLAAHRDIESCAKCHQKIDPPGFALENFDILGGWRERYRVWPDEEKKDTSTPEPTDEAIEGQRETLISVTGFGKNGQPFRFQLGPQVDASGQLGEDRRFDDVKEFKQHLLADERQLARNLVQHLTVYATGAPVGFSDRTAIELILSKTESNGYRVADLIRELVLSDLFLRK